MFVRQSRLIVANAWPMLVAQLASMGMMVIDTVLLGHFGTEDLAAVAVGSGIYIALILALAGVVQAVSPAVAHFKGAGRETELAATLHQGFWLALFLSVPGVFCLLHPDPLFALSPIDAGVEAKARAYLAVLAWGMPAALLYRTFYAFCVAVGLPRPLMIISLCCTLAHGLLAGVLVTGAWGGDALGAVGCGVSNAAIGWLALAAGAAYMVASRHLRSFRLLHGWTRPRLDAQMALLKLGLPMGLSSFVEISAFTLIALFVAQLGAPIVAAHRVVANLAGICYMLPLSLAVATLVQVGLAAGARDWPRARISAAAGVAVASVLSFLIGLALWLLKGPVIAAYSGDPLVREVSLSLIGYLAAYQIFDAAQTVAAHALRGYKITFMPMLVHLAAFWGVGLFGGWWLAFRTTQPMGAAGFWIASLLSLVFAAMLLGGMLWRAASAEG